MMTPAAVVVVEPPFWDAKSFWFSFDNALNCCSILCCWLLEFDIRLFVWACSFDIGDVDEDGDDEEAFEHVDDNDELEELWGDEALTAADVDVGVDDKILE